MIQDSLFLLLQSLTLNENIFSLVYSRCECDCPSFWVATCVECEHQSKHTQRCVKKNAGKTYTASLHKTQKKLKIYVKKIYICTQKIHICTQKIYIFAQKICKNTGCTRKKKQQEYAKHIKKHEVTFFVRVFGANDVLLLKCFFTQMHHYSFFSKSQF